MDEKLREFVHHKNGWDPPSKKVDPNIRGEKIGTLWLDGRVLSKGPFPLLQTLKKSYCKNYGVSKENAAKRFKITY